VEKGEGKRFHVAAHGWEADEYTAHHGQNVVSYITDIIGKDIGMLDPAVPVCNDFLQMNCKAGNLISCRDVDIGDICSVDSCYTGAQRFGFAGTRNRKRPPRKHGPSWPHFCIVLEEDIYSARTSVSQHPMARFGMRQTPLFRLAKCIGCVGSSCGRYSGIFL
jgi:hypothetical protein